jgi:hypothetical protein
MMMQHSKVPFRYSEFPWERDIIYPKIINNMGARCQERSPSWHMFFYSYFVINKASKNGSNKNYMMVV